jgi:hypothetical protein
VLPLEVEDEDEDEDEDDEEPLVDVVSPVELPPLPSTMQ